MKKLTFTLGLSAVALSASATQIEQVIVRQQWPWSTDVKVEYRLSGVVDPVDVAVRAYNGATELDAVKLRDAITGELTGITEGGVRSFVIDPVRAFGTEKIALSDFRVKLVVNDAALYRVFNLQPPYDITDISRTDLRSGVYGTYETNYANIVPASSIGEVLIWTGVTNNPIYKTTHLVMRRVSSAGMNFTMGASTDERGQKYDSLNYKDYETPHTVSFTNDFFVSVFPVTACQHKLILGQTPDTGDVSLRKPQTPVLFTDLRGYFIVNGKSGWWPDAGVWSADGFVPDAAGNPHDVDAASVLAKLRQMTGENTFDLPKEARWEFACRAGTTTATYAGDLTCETSAGPDSALEQIAWYSANSEGVMHEVGLKAANPWGLYDMLGNVQELCLDISVNNMDSSPAVDPVGSTSSNRFHLRKVRGGGYSTVAYRVRSAFRGQAVNPHAEVADENGGYRLIFEAR